VLLLNDPVRPQVAFTLTGFVVSPIEVDPVPAFYISQFQGESATQSVTIRNNQDHDIQITGSERRGAHFAIDHAVLEPGRSFTVTASATPDTPPGRYREAVMIFTDDPDRPKIRLGVNILVKQDLHSSTDAIDMGRVRLASLRANPDLLTLLGQTFILESRHAGTEILGVETDLRFVTVRQYPEGAAQRFRFDVNLDLDKLVPGEHRGTLHIRTSAGGGSPVSLPISVVVEP
jgi:hypothetical protein